MKHFNLTLTLLFAMAVNAMAGIPAGYYIGIDGKSSTDLKAALYEIINPHTMYAYGDLWECYRYTYYVLTDWDQVLDLYSNEVNYFDDGHSTLNREHSVPQSWWDNGTSVPPGTDLYNVMPSDTPANSAKANYPWGVVDEGKATFDNDVTKVGTGTVGETYSGTVFEPADWYKGDFARIGFYMATCYPDIWNDEAIMMSNDLPLTLLDDFATMLMAWSNADPVDEGEIQRNEDVCKYQLNRNPFIDYPELVDYIWGDKSGEAFYLSEHTANEGQSNDNMPTQMPTINVQYSTDVDNPLEIQKGTEVTFTGGTNESTLYTRINGSEWEEIEPTLGNNNSPIAATKTYTIDDYSIIEAYCTRDGYAQSKTLTVYYSPIDYNDIYLLYEAFDEISDGGDGGTSESNNQWSGNDNFPTVDRAYCAGGAVRLGTSSYTGSITSRTLDTNGGNIYVNFDVKGWTTVEGNISVQLTGASAQIVSYTATISSDVYDHISLSFTDVSANPTLTIATTAKRAFIDNVIVNDEPIDTGIESVATTPVYRSTGAYNLAGQRINPDTYKGIYIKDGHKVLK